MRDHLEDPRVHLARLLDDLEAELDVPAHQRELAGVELAWLAEDFLRDAGLADVEEHGAERDDPERVALEADLAAEGGCPHRRGERMRVQVTTLAANAHEAGHGGGVAQHAVHHGQDRGLELVHVELARILELAHHVLDRRRDRNVNAGSLLDLVLQLAHRLGGRARRAALRERLRTVLVALRVDHDLAAVAADRGDLFVALDIEALEQERRLEPGTVQLGHVHPDCELGDGDFPVSGQGDAFRGRRLVR